MRYGLLVSFVDVLQMQELGDGTARTVKKNTNLKLNI